MMIEGCPVEILDKIFELSAYSDPEHAQATIYALMLTCSYFHTVAERHFIRIVCLPNAEKVNAFASYLKQVVKGADYGKGVLPIQHLAVAGKYKYRIPPGLHPRRCSDAEVEAERIFPFILTTAAPSLLTLAIFGMDTGYRHVKAKWRYKDERAYVSDGTTFPKLLDFVALDQHVISLVLWDNNGGPDKQACQLRYPSLRRLYIPGNGGGSLPSALPSLDDLRLEMLDSACSGPLREEVGHVRSLIIDAPQYFSFIASGHTSYAQLRDEYASKMSEYQTLIEEVGNSEHNGIVVPDARFTHYADRGRILSGWADAVVGGEGCWTSAWIPTVPYTGPPEN